MDTTLALRGSVTPSRRTLFTEEDDYGLSRTGFPGALSHRTDGVRSVSSQAFAELYGHNLYRYATCGRWPGRWNLSRGSLDDMDVAEFLVGDMGMGAVMGCAGELDAAKVYASREIHTLYPA